MQWLMLQYPSQRDYIISAGEEIMVRDLILLAASGIGVALEFKGVVTSETGKVVKLPLYYLGSMWLRQTTIKLIGHIPDRVKW